MTGKSIFVMTIVAALILSACCLRFTDQTPGAEFQVGDTFTTCGTDIRVEQFQWSNGNWTTSGSARVDTNNYAMGAGKDINARNSNLRFLFNYPLNEIDLKFGELGGNNNIEVNGDFRNVDDLISLNGVSVGNCLITVNAGQQGYNWHGTIKVDGNIDSFAIGGQELWIDNVCYQK